MEPYKFFVYRWKTPDLTMAMITSRYLATHDDVVLTGVFSGPPPQELVDHIADPLRPEDSPLVPEQEVDPAWVAKAQRLLAIAPDIAYVHQ